MLKILGKIMGDIAEYYMSHLIEEDFVEKAKADKLEEAYEARKLYWETKTGKKILVHELTDSHIKNIINMLLKKHGHRNHDHYWDTVLSVFRSEIKMRHRKGVTI